MDGHMIISSVDYCARVCADFMLKLFAPATQDFPHNSRLPLAASSTFGPGDLSLGTSEFCCIRSNENGSLFVVSRWPSFRKIWNCQTSMLDLQVSTTDHAIQASA